MYSGFVYYFPVRFVMMSDIIFLKKYVMPISLSVGVGENIKKKHFLGHFLRPQLKVCAQPS